MKNILLYVFILVNFLSCKPEPEPIPDKHNYYYLTAEQLAKTPYFTNPSFDTLSFVSNQNDTVVFAKTRVDSGWYREIDFNPGVEFTTYHYYQQISANYQTIKGEGSFGVVHSKKLAGGYTNNILITINEESYHISESWLSKSFNYKYSIDSISLNNKTYNDIIFVFSKLGDTASNRVYLNKEFGALKIENVLNGNYLYLNISK